MACVKAQHILSSQSVSKITSSWRACWSSTQCCPHYCGSAKVHCMVSEIPCTPWFQCTQNLFLCADSIILNEFLIEVVKAMHILVNLIVQGWLITLRCYYLDIRQEFYLKLHWLMFPTIKLFHQDSAWIPCHFKRQYLSYSVPAIFIISITTGTVELLIAFPYWSFPNCKVFDTSTSIIPNRESTLWIKYDMSFLCLQL